MNFVQSAAIYADNEADRVAKVLHDASGLGVTRAAIILELERAYISGARSALQHAEAMCQEKIDKYKRMLDA